jgi:hypothetical protein
LNSRVDRIAAPYRSRLALFDAAQFERDVATEKRKRSRWLWCSRCGLKLGRSK